MIATDQQALQMRDVRVELVNGAPVIDGVNLSIGKGEIVGLVGESGSGKTTTALSIFGLATRGLSMTGGDIAVGGKVVGDGTKKSRQRGASLGASYVPQNPGTALNPSMRVARAIEDLIRNAHGTDLSARSTELLEKVGLPGDRQFGRRFPHQLSGGQQQRVCIAASMAPEPSLVVLDEPTTGLDVVTQQRILNELMRLCAEEQVGMLYITHDLAVAAQIANRIAVMYAGEIVELGPTEQVLRSPRHPYTRGLMASTPDHVDPPVLETMPGISLGVGERPAGCCFASRCPQSVARCDHEHPMLLEVQSHHEVRCFEWFKTPTSLERVSAAEAMKSSRILENAPTVLKVEHLRAEHVTRQGTVVAASDISFDVSRGSCVALVGESGSGKTTIARVIAGLHPAASGELLLDGQPLPRHAAKRSREQRRRIQIVFQNPSEALNPRHTVESSIARPARILRRLSDRQARAEVADLLDSVRLPARVAKRYPRELSGGERQRVAIARALAAKPDLIVCDEVTSALDVSVQAVVLQLLSELRSDLGLALVFITHDLGVVASVADHMLVLSKGEICESGPAMSILTDPQHPYTKSLLEAAPSIRASLR
jgi:peptide/nickel transport system ATP-binding protein